MSLYAPVFLRFMHGVLDAFFEAEAFVFHTRLTHISPALRCIVVLRQCIPGCETIEKLSDMQMRATVRLKVGPVKASFNGLVTLSDFDPPNGSKTDGVRD